MREILPHSESFCVPINLLRLCGTRCLRASHRCYAAKYMLCLPKEEELAQLLSEWVVREGEIRYER